MSGPPVVIVQSRGIPVTPVDARAPVLTVASNGRGMPVTIADNAHPFILEGYSPSASLSALSSDDGATLADDDENLMETYNDGSPA